MAFSLVANYFVSGSTNLTNGQPFGLESAEGLSGMDIVRFRQNSPQQQGVSDLGFRLQPRILTLNIVFSATSDTVLDGYRDTLMTVFRPTFTVTLVATRDDGGVRYLQCVPVEEVKIDIAPELRPGHTHRAVAKLKSVGDPTWYSAAATDTYTLGTAQSWWNAGGAISDSNVMEHRENINGGSAWTYAGTLTGSWSVVFRTVLDTTSTHTAFHAGTGALQAGLTKDARFYRGTSVWYNTDGSVVAFTDAEGIGGTPNIMVVQNSAAGLQTVYWAGTANAGSNAYDADISGSTRRWRTDRSGSVATLWADPLYKAAVYDVALTQAQRIMLDGWMSDYPVLGTISAVNSGDINDYPYIVLGGPLYHPVLTNSTTGAALNFGSVSLGSGELYRIDLRTGNKTVTDVNGNNCIPNMGSPIQLARFLLVPGTNNITVQAGSATSSSYVSIQHYNRYLGI